MSLVYATILQFGIFAVLAFATHHVSEGDIAWWVALAAILGLKLFFYAVSWVARALTWQFEERPTIVTRMLRYLRFHQMPTAELGWGHEFHFWADRIERGHDEGLVTFRERTVQRALTMHAMFEIVVPALPPTIRARILMALEEAIRRYGHERGMPDTVEGITKALAEREVRILARQRQCDVS